jgi:NADH:ubiquinone oxidoreductase subunit 5 (subunit L)/multisubunit Na+/H+ antiporter MnhA subunit
MEKKEEDNHNFEELEAFDIHKFFMSENKKKKTTEISLPKKRSVYLIFFLSLITLGIYTSFWFKSRSFELNNLDTKKKMPKIIPTILVITSVVSIFSLVTLMLSISPEEMGVLYQNTTSMQSALMILFLAGSLLTFLISIILSFYARSLINESLKYNKNLETKLSGFLTFIFGAFYIQYEINRIIDDKEETQKKAPWIVLTVIIILLALSMFLGA